MNRDIQADFKWAAIAAGFGVANIVFAASDTQILALHAISAGISIATAMYSGITGMGKLITAGTSEAQPTSRAGALTPK